MVIIHVVSCRFMLLEMSSVNTRKAVLKIARIYNKAVHLPLLMQQYQSFYVPLHILNCMSTMLCLLTLFGKIKVNLYYKGSPCFVKTDIFCIRFIEKWALLGRDRAVICGIQKTRRSDWIKITAVEMAAIQHTDLLQMGVNGARTNVERRQEMRMLGLRSYQSNIFTSFYRMVDPNSDRP